METADYRLEPSGRYLFSQPTSVVSSNGRLEILAVSVTVTPHCTGHGRGGATEAGDMRQRVAWHAGRQARTD